MESSAVASKSSADEVQEEKASASLSPCPNKEVCGSCKWSHIPYDKQLEQKLSDINGSLKLKGLPAYCTSITPSPRETHYRNRMDFTINYQGLVGLREKGKWWRVLDGHCCFISDEKIESVFHQVRSWVQESGLSFFDRKAHTGLLRYAVVRTALTGETLLTIITSAPEETDAGAEEKIAQLVNIPEVTSLVWGINHTQSDTSEAQENRVLNGDGYIADSINGFQYEISPYWFFQSNSAGAELLMDRVMNYAERAGGKRVLDLYCGSGFFTIPLAKRFEHVFGVEIVPEAIETAQRNAARNGVSPEFAAEKSEGYGWERFEPDTVIVDPPRSGMHDKALAKLKAYAPKHIVHVSCNYKQLARELTVLGDDYRVEEMTAIDMFPHTPHVEVVTLLNKVE